MPGLDWLTARPIAHRGLHDAEAGVVENTRAAAAAAADAGFAIEVDLQRAADGVPMVFHDVTLDRLTEASGRLADRTAAQLQAVRFLASPDPMMRLTDLLALVAGRVPLVLEIKSAFDGDLRLAMTVADILAGYAGPVAAMSFDPAVVRALRDKAPGLPRGIVAERHYAHAEWAALPAREKARLAHLGHLMSTKPHFVAYRVQDLPTAATLFTRWVLGMPLLTWTVRRAKDRARARRWADQMIFEGFRP